MHWAVVLVIVIRILGYIYTLRRPFPGILLSFLLDILDCSAFYFTGSTVAYYEFVDKPVDFIGYLFLIPVAKKTPIYPYFLGLLAWRSLGMLFYYLTGSRLSFIIFPNFIEYSLLFYYISNWAQQSASPSRFILWLRAIRWQDYRVWIVLLLAKLVQEVGLHGPTADSRTYWMWEQIERILKL